MFFVCLFFMCTSLPWQLTIVFREKNSRSKVSVVCDVILRRHKVRWNVIFLHGI